VTSGDRLQAKGEVTRQQIAETIHSINDKALEDLNILSTKFSLIAEVPKASLVRKGETQ